MKLISKIIEKKEQKKSSSQISILKEDEVDNIIIFESNPELTGNTYEIYLHFLKKGLNNQYKLYWLVEDVTKYNNYPIENVFFMSYIPTDKEEEKKHAFIKHRAKMIISENRCINKTNINTFSLYLNHGTPLKDVSGIYNFGNSYNYIICPTEHLAEMYRRLYKVETNQLYFDGYPRNDVLLQSNSETKVKLKMENYSKILLWMPTFRQHKNKIRVDSENIFPLGIPIFQNENELLEINSFLQSLNCLLILKLHPAQDRSYINVDSLSHIKIIEDEELTNNDIKLYEFVGISDALITDYSSIYLDYLLTKKPIGLTLDDIHTYKLGFIFKDIENYLVGEKLSTIDDLKKFIQDVLDGNDQYLEAREVVNKKMNPIRKEKTYTESIFENVIKPNL